MCCLILNLWNSIEEILIHFHLITRILLCIDYIFKAKIYGEESAQCQQQRDRNIF